MEVLLCGFEPFGDRPINNAWKVAKQFIGIAGIDVLKLPVSFNRAHQTIIETLRRKNYDLILILGETAATLDYIRLERLAINYKDAVRPDNDGIRPDDEEIIPDAPKAYFTPFPVKRIATLLKEQGHPVKVSNSAGTFVCNSTYYHILHHLTTNTLPQTALFIHIPATTDQIPLPQITKTIQAILNHTAPYPDPLAPFNCTM